MSSPSSVQAGLAGNTVWIRVSGRGSFQNSAGLKNFADAMLRRGHHEFVVDLHDCELMDSTFMGTLVGIALKVGDKGSLTVIRANPRNRDVLANLGLDRILRVEDQAPVAHPAPADTSAIPAAATGRDTIVQAHRNLAAINPENAIRFKDVLEFLTSEQDQPQGSP
jgi:anti-sigma B factor antagonist